MKNNHISKINLFTVHIALTSLSALWFHHSSGAIESTLGPNAWSSQAFSMIQSHRLHVSFIFTKWSDHSLFMNPSSLIHGHFFPLLQYYPVLNDLAIPCILNDSVTSLACFNNPFSMIWSSLIYEPVIAPHDSIIPHAFLIFPAFMKIIHLAKNV